VRLAQEIQGANKQHQTSPEGPDRACRRPARARSPSAFPISGLSINSPETGTALQAQLITAQANLTRLHHVGEKKKKGWGPTPQLLENPEKAAGWVSSGGHPGPIRPDRKKTRQRCSSASRPPDLAASDGVAGIRPIDVGNIHKPIEVRTAWFVVTQINPISDLHAAGGHSSCRPPPQTSAAGEKTRPRLSRLSPNSQDATVCWDSRALLGPPVNNEILAEPTGSEFQLKANFPNNGEQALARRNYRSTRACSSILGHNGMERRASGRAGRGPERKLTCLTSSKNPDNRGRGPGGFFFLFPLSPFRKVGGRVKRGSGR